MPKLASSCAGLTITGPTANSAASSASGQGRSGGSSTKSAVGNPAPRSSHFTRALSRTNSKAAGSLPVSACAQRLDPAGYQRLASPHAGKSLEEIDHHVGLAQSRQFGQQIGQPADADRASLVTAACSAAVTAATDSSTPASLA